MSLSLLIVNIIAGFLFGVAFMTFLLKGDPILAAVPAILALPALLLQPWYFFFFPNGLFPAPFLTTLVSIPVYTILERKGKLQRLKFALARLKSRRTALSLGGVIVFLILLGLARSVDFPALRHGVPQSLEFELRNLDLELGDSRHYLLGGFIDTQWIWQIRLPEEEMQLLAGELNMQPIPADQVGDAFFSMPPYWWRPTVSDQTRAFSTNSFPLTERGSDGLHTLASWNPEDQILHMWIKDNF